MTRFFLSVLAVLAFCVSCSPSLEDVTEEQTIATKEMNQQSATEPPFNDAPMSCTPAQPSYGANTIEDCYTLSQAARQSYCNYYNYCRPTALDLVAMDTQAR